MAVDQGESQSLSIEDRMAAIFEPEEEQAEPQQANDEVEEEAEEVEAESETEEVDEETEESDPEEDNEESDEEETEKVKLVEVDIDGVTYEVPEALKDKFMFQADYTKKTQEVAEQRKQVETMQAQLQEQARIQQMTLQEHAQLVALDEKLQEYNKVDWNALYEQDSSAFVMHKEAMRDLKDARETLSNQIQQKQQQLQQQQTQTRIQALKEGQEILAREIPNWNTDLAKNLNTFAIDKFGFTPEEVNNVFDPRVVKLLHKAYLHDKQSSKNSVVNKKVKHLPKVSKPGSTSKQTVQYSAQQKALKSLKKSGSLDDAANVFLSKM